MTLVMVIHVLCGDDLPCRTEEGSGSFSWESLSSRIEEGHDEIRARCCRIVPQLEKFRDHRITKPRLPTQLLSDTLGVMFGGSVQCHAGVTRGLSVVWPRTLGEQASGKGKTNPMPGSLDGAVLDFH